MASKCFSLVRGRAMRVTRVDGCGRPILGPNSQIVSDGFITVSLTSNINAGTAIEVTNAAGAICILDRPCPVFTDYSIEVAFCGVNPDLYEMMTGQPIVLDGDGEGVGFRMNSGITACDPGVNFALEVWSTVPGNVCDEDTPVGGEFGYFLLPFIRGGTIGDFTIGNDAVNFTLTGASSKDGAGWDVGPYDVVLDEAGLPSPLLVAIDPKDHLHVQLTGVAPPTADGCATLPVGTLATGGNADGTFEPDGSYAPDDFAALTADPLDALPATAWTTGQHITLLDGTFAHWDGTDWVAGAAP